MIGLLPALGLGLRDLHASGQLGRLVGHEFKAYAKAFGGRALWCSYRTVSQEAEAIQEIGWALDGSDRGWLSLLPKGEGWPPFAWALVLPVARRTAIRRCRGLRVLSLTGALPALVAQRLWGMPYVLQVGYDAPAVARAHGKPLRACLLWAFERWAVRRAQGVVFASEVLRARVGALAKGQITVIPNGVDLEAFRPRWRPNSGHSPKRVAYVGRLSREKRLPALVEACQRLHAELHCFGEGPLRPLLSGQPWVRLHGAVPHESLPKRLAAMDLFCLPSATEGSPKALLEAMACGLPAVVSRPVAEAVLLRDEVFPPPFGIADGDLTESLSALLDPVTANLFSALGRAFVQARHDLKKTLAAEVAFVQNVLDGAHGQAGQKTAG